MNCVHTFYLWSWIWQNLLLFVSFGFSYMNICLILFFGVTESSNICYCLILLALIFTFLYLFGLNRDLKILFVFVWSPKIPLLAMPDHHHFDEKLKLFFSYSNLTKYLFIITDYHILQITWQFLLKGWYFFILKVFTFLSHHTEPKIFIFAYYILTNIFIRHFEITLLFSRYKLSKV